MNELEDIRMIWGKKKDGGRYTNELGFSGDFGGGTGVLDLKYTYEEKGLGFLGLRFRV